VIIAVSAAVQIGGTQELGEAPEWWQMPYSMIDWQQIWVADGQQL